MKTAISLPDSPFASADTLARRLGISRSQLFATAVAEFLAKHQCRKVTDRLNAVHGSDEQTVGPAVSLAQAQSVGPDAW
ncbi:MAG: hypothetical protein WD690_15515 [Vicinamibacterales bacterium]